MITYDPEKRLFHLQGKDTSYVMQVIRGGCLSHLYWGKRLKTFRGSNPLQFLDRGFSPSAFEDDRTFSPDTIPQEYPVFGSGDFNPPACQLQMEAGNTITDLCYHSHTIYPGKPTLDGLPAVYVEEDQEATTLELVLYDQLVDLRVTLLYTVFRDHNAITRSARFHNGGQTRLRLLRAMSACVDFRDAEFDLLTLHGAHINERNVARRPLAPGLQAAESRRGHSSHQQAPFMALLRRNADEDQGEVYGFNLVYSGNFLAEVEVGQFATARANIGINPFDFSWMLESGEQLQTPEVVMVYSDQGLDGMSQTYHSLYRHRLCRGQFRERERPILINNWEATYFKFNADKIVELASAGKDLGLELFALDDGWFGQRDNDDSSLGDWVIDRRKLPDGMGALAQRVRDMGLEFGLWFEPEMISENSNLYRAHPDWCLHAPGRRRTLSRMQLVLDLSRQDVCDYIIESVGKVLDSAPITYVKWDMNRHMTEVGSAVLPAERQRETAHRYMLGLYRVMDTLVTRFPHILFESCSGGGGRFDPALLYYMPQVWTSDNTDAICRLKIQYGTSLTYPPITMASHVSAVPNHQVHRKTPLAIRGHVAMSGNLGYELDLTKMSEEEKAIVKAQVASYKAIRHIIQLGTFHRIRSPFAGNDTAWMFVSQDQTEVVAFYFRVLCQPNAPVEIFKLKALDADALYRDLATGEEFGGDELMYAGRTLPFTYGDFISHMYHYRRVA